MFSIEHEFDCTVITILDEGSKQLTEDISVTNFEECTTLEQYDPINDRINKITFSNYFASILTPLGAPLGDLRRRLGFQGAPRASQTPSWTSIFIDFGSIFERISIVFHRFFLSF